MPPKPRGPRWPDAPGGRHATSAVEDFSIRADSSEVPRVAAWLGQVGSAEGVPAEPLWRLDLCVTEALANVIDHGGTGAGAQPIRLRLEVRRGGSGGEAAVTVSDAGIRYDPVAAQPKPRPRTLAEAEPGGQGLTILRKFADTLDYAYREDRNHLTIRVRWSRDGENAP
jgi:anti-sigma regulatory factor (Ser/Thr protein kinase)